MLKIDFGKNEVPLVKYKLSHSNWIPENVMNLVSLIIREGYICISFKKEAL